jgi:threonine aldolase
MANQTAIKLHTQPGEQLIADKYAHVYHYEGGGAHLIAVFPAVY